MSQTLAYVYAIVPSTADVSAAPGGIDDCPVLVESADGVAALVSMVDAQVYAAASLDERVADLSWLGTRAVAHDRVQTWGSDAGPLVPLPMFTLFSDRASVRRMLDARADALAGALSHAALGREYG